MFDISHHRSPHYPNTKKNTDKQQVADEILQEYKRIMAGSNHQTCEDGISHADMLRKIQQHQHQHQQHSQSQQDQFNKSKLFSSMGMKAHKIYEGVLGNPNSSYPLFHYNHSTSSGDNDSRHHNSNSHSHSSHGQINDGHCHAHTFQDYACEQNEVCIRKRTESTVITDITSPQQRAAFASISKIAMDLDDSDAIIDELAEIERGLAVVNVTKQGDKVIEDDHHHDHHHGGRHQKIHNGHHHKKSHRHHHRRHHNDDDNSDRETDLEEDASFVDFRRERHSSYNRAVSAGSIDTSDHSGDHLICDFRRN